MNSFHNPVIIDSVQVINGDSILYPSPSIVPVVNGEGNYCLNPKQASWLGKAIIIKENGENTFINVDNDTLVFNTQAVLNEVWEVIRWNDSSYIEAEVTSISQESFLGQEDFVKTISFRVIGREEDFSKIENERVKISENYGLMRTFNFHYFPHIEAFDYLELDEYLINNGNIGYDSTFISLATMELSGLSNPFFGVKELETIDVYDYEIGDEIHIVEGYRFLSQIVEDRVIQEILDKTVFGLDSVKYLIRIVKENEEPINSIAEESIITIDTIELMVRANDFIEDQNQFSGISQFDDNGLFFNQAFMHQLYRNDNNRLVKTFNNASNYIMRESLNDICWVETPAMNSEEFFGFTGLSYIEGVGGPFYMEDIIDNTNYRSLIYYNKGEEFFGTPQIITGINSSTESESHVILYPNPSNGEFKIESDDFNKLNQIIILDLNGQQVFQSEVENKDHIFNLSDLNTGIYVYKIITESGGQMIGRLTLN